MYEATYVIIGGGIAGVTCAEGLSILDTDEKTILISESDTVKAVTNVSILSKLCNKFDVEERDADSLGLPSVTVLKDKVTDVDFKGHLIRTRSGKRIKYEKICICSGARPKLILDNPYVIGLRDTDSVKDFQKRISSSRRILVVGNGGIATELVHELDRVEIIWAIKDKHISATFVDPGAAEFFQSKLKGSKMAGGEKLSKRMRYTVGSNSTAALGPDWHTSVNLQGMLEGRSVTVEYCCEVKSLAEGKDGWPVAVELSNSKVYGCDLIVSATGVTPNTAFLGNKLELASDGGIKVNDKLEASLTDVYAAGDACTAAWTHADQWLQMRLWTQARQMGSYAAKSMFWSRTGQEILQDFCFELFTHATDFFGMKVVLLGLFNGQKLDNKYDLLLRITKGVEYIKLVLKDGKMQGAVLIGETDLEEMCENLILNQLDLTPYGEDLLNPDIDIEDYFD